PGQVPARQRQPLPHLLFQANSPSSPPSFCGLDALDGLIAILHAWVHDLSLASSRQGLPDFIHFLHDVIEMPVCLFPCLLLVFIGEILSLLFHLLDELLRLLNGTYLPYLRGLFL